MPSLNGNVKLWSTDAEEGYIESGAFFFNISKVKYLELGYIIYIHKENYKKPLGSSWN